jgi:hypothetical protein
MFYDIQEQETTLKQCIVQLEIVDVVRIPLMNQLKEALFEQVLALFSLSSKCFFSLHMPRPFSKLSFLFL